MNHGCFESSRWLRAWLVAAILVLVSFNAIQARADQHASAVSLGDDAPAISKAKPLGLGDVIASVDQQFPMIAAAEAERDAREGTVVAEQGRFDAQLTADAAIRPLGFYEGVDGSVELSQPTRLWGARFFGGYRIGAGDYPSYYGRTLTDDRGEISGGIEVPLLRGGAIDESRAALDTSRLSVDVAEIEIELQRIAAERDAANAFWGWLAAGQRVGVAQQLLDTADARMSQIEGRVLRGAQSRIDFVDSERLVFDRKLRLRAAERDLRQAAIAMSLYLRDEFGNPDLVAADRLPEQFPAEHAPDEERFKRELIVAGEQHPIVRRFEFDRRRLQIAADLARNEALPGINVLVAGSQDFGDSRPGIDETGKLSPSPRSETEVKALVRFDLPLQRRDARGKRTAAEARLARLDQKMRYTRDRIRADGLDAIESLIASYELISQARKNLELAGRMRAAEERKLELGSSNLINVNIREVQEASAAKVLIDAQAEYFKARADYAAAVARPIEIPPETVDGA